MNTPKTPNPPRVPSLIPHLVCDDASAAIDFYERAFGAVELTRLPGPDGRLMHACIEIDGARVMLMDSNRAWNALSPKMLGGVPVSIHLYVADADAAAARAVAAGARLVMPVADMFWGDRYGVLEDPSGHKWAVATPQRQLSAQEIVAAAAKAMAEPCPEAKG